MVHIARSDWPEKYPDFFNDVLMLVSSPNSSSTILGLLFLQTASEELGTPRDGLLYTRKAELKQRLLQLIPQTLAILTGISMLCYMADLSINGFKNNFCQDYFKVFGKNERIP